MLFDGGKKMKILILAGGLSPERDVSHKSSCLVANALLSKGYEVAIVDLYEGISSLEGIYRSGLEQPYSYDIPETEPDLEALIAKNGGRRAWVGPNVIEAATDADYVFLGLHGGSGENGQVQSLLDAYGIKYTGSGYLGCAITMDKDISKAIVASIGIKTAKWIKKDYSELKTADKVDAFIEEICEQIGIPCVVKPIGCGSSCGVSIPNTKAELMDAIKYAISYEQAVLVEAFIKGREITVGVLNGKALPITEIIPHEGFYDYKNKYQAGLTEHICPANFTDEQTSRAKETAQKIFTALRMEQYGRIDMIYTPDTDEFWFIEGNNLPGMTNTSLLPEAAGVMGIKYEDLCEMLALRREQ